jgi:hypothetical protein
MSHTVLTLLAKSRAPFLSIHVYTDELLFSEAIMAFPLIKPHPSADGLQHSYYRRPLPTEPFKYDSDG